MALTDFEWQNTVDRVMARFRKNFACILISASPEARLTIDVLFALKRIAVSGQLGEKGFQLDEASGTLEIGLEGLNLIYAAGERSAFYGLDVEDFRELAVSLYVFHEVHHVAQKLVEFSDVQMLKRTAGADKLGELDLIADTVAAQIFAAIHASEFTENRSEYAAAFFGALYFMIAFCFPAFGFPLSKRHKVQRAFGIVLMAIAVERAIKRGDLSIAFDTPLYPYFSKDHRELVILAYGGAPTISAVHFSASLRPESVVELLSLIDSGNAVKILEKARMLV